MARNISDDELYVYSYKIKGQTVVITGAANGLGKAAAIEYGKRGANMVIGDIDLQGAEGTVAEIKKTGGYAICQSCDVLNYDDLVSLFELAVAKFGSVDVVIANAGVTEIGGLTTVKVNERGLPIRPNLKTLEVNLLSVVTTAQLATHYFGKNKKEDSLKALVLIGSVASLSGLTGAPLYTAAKHGVLGLMRALTAEYEFRGFRVATVCPFFADTAIVPPATKVFMAGVPLVPIPRVAGAMFLAATDGAPDTHGAAYTLPDENEVFRIPHTGLTQGMYEVLDKRLQRLKSTAQWLTTVASLFKMFASSSVGRFLGVVVIAYFYARYNNETLGELASRIAEYPRRFLNSV